MEDPVTKPLHLALLVAFIFATTSVSVAGCNVECSEGEAYNDEAELCMPIESVSS